MLSVYQILKNGICGKRPQQVQSKSKERNVLLNKVDADDSVSEEEAPHDLRRSRRKESLDQIEQQMNKIMVQKEQKRNTLLKKMKIKIEGDNVPPFISNFTKMSKKIDLKLIQRTNYSKPTSIQMAAIPIILAKRNLIAVAPTGSGKTAAFSLPILENLGNHEEGGPRCLVFSPSQELAQQIFKDLVKLNGNKLSIKYLQQMNRDKLAFKQAWEHMDLLVCSPLKFLKLHHKVDLCKVEYVVMDEADKYFELGMLKQVEQLLKIFEQQHMTYMFFSATLPEPVEQIFKDLVIDPIKVQVGGRNHVLKTVDQKLTYCSNEYGKMEEMKNLINEGKMSPPVLIFVQSKSRAEQLLYEMESLKIHTQLRVSCIHGTMETEQREKIVNEFHRGQIWILICTDMMARGIDFKGVNLVINYDFPNSMITYVHRVGRTGRAGTTGKAITFFTDEDKPMLRSLGNVLKVSGCEVPSWLFDLKQATKSVRKHLERFPVKREFDQ